MDDPKIHIAIALNRLRAERGQSVSDLARALGVAQSTVSDWVTGNKMPRHNALVKLCVYFGVALPDLLQPADTSGNIDLTMLLLDETTPVAVDGQDLSPECRRLLARVVRAILVDENC
jgi:transcriptional regulator with XRE-family HTH domain